MGASPQMIICGYGNCQPTTWTRQVQVVVYRKAPLAPETVWVKEVVNGVVTGGGVFATGCVVAVLGAAVAALVAPETSGLNIGGNVYAVSCISTGVSSALTWLSWKI